jgi:hypothetical protein
MADHDDMISDAARKSLVKNRLPDCGASMSLVGVEHGVGVTGAPSRLRRFERDL